MERTWRAIARVGGLAVLMTAAGVGVRAQEQPVSSTGGQDPGKTEQVSVPRTAEEHFERAAKYKEKAAGYRREADEHRRMLGEYKARQTPPGLETKLGQEPPWVKKMRQHCERYIRAAETMAAEAERFAEFHRLRGEEMRGN